MTVEALDGGCWSRVQLCWLIFRSTVIDRRYSSWFRKFLSRTALTELDLDIIP